MNVIRHHEARQLHPLDVVLLFLIALTVGGGFLLLSAAESLTLVDGAVEWQAESPLRAVVQLLCLNYSFPTVNAGDVKGYILGLGAGLAVLAISIAALSTSRGGSLTTTPSDEGRSETTLRGQMSPLTAAQLLVVLFLLWSFASSRWSPSPQIAVSAAVLLAIQYLWSIALANGLGRRAARVATYLILGATLAASVLAVWYFYGRNPTLRAKFPFGNPTFLAACLIPGIAISFTLMARGIGNLARVDSKTTLPCVLGGAGVLVFATWAFVLADSRASQVGLGAALLAAAFLAFRGRWKLAPVAIAVLMAIAGGRTYLGTAGESRSGRGESLRLRGYAWDYALQMFEQRPFTGFGQGGFALMGDTFAVNDLLHDPLVFESRIEHAHNEWLETLADLGAAGLGLLASAMALTFWSGVLALRTAMHPADRWALIGSLAGLFGLVVEEFAGVGLRVSEVPVAYYTVLGVAWALAAPAESRAVTAMSRVPWYRTVAGGAGILMALAVLLMTQLDFDAARSAQRTQELLARGELEAAINAAERGRPRLDPQRELVSRARLAEAHIAVAEHVFARALDRDRRARASELADQRLAGLAQADVAETDGHLKSAGQALKELIESSPGFINSGWLEYRIHLLRARIAAMLGNEDAAKALQASAATALEREMLRQPFNAELAMAYVRVAMGDTPLPKLMDVLARPLRYGRMTDAYLDILQRLEATQGFDEAFGEIVNEALMASRDATSADPSAKPQEVWACERLRLAAALRFMRGDYNGAVDLLSPAVDAYKRNGDPTTLGPASCRAELAEALFFRDPLAPKQAIEEARHAMAMAPESRLGREFRGAVRQRLIHYHLALGDENEARRLLRESAATGVSNQVVEHELGIRLRKLCESILLQRREALVLRKSPVDLLPKIQTWLSRSLEINPDDYAAHFLAADLAMHAGDDAAAARHVRTALQYGLHPEDALRFLRMAREQKPDSPALESLWHELGGNSGSDGRNSDAQSPPAEFEGTGGMGRP